MSSKKKTSPATPSRGGFFSNKKHTTASQHRPSLAAKVEAAAAQLPVEQQRQYELKLAELRRKLARESAIRQAAEEELEAAKGELAIAMSLSEPKAARRRRDRVRPDGSATAVLCLNDWHLEETIDAATVGGVNEYNEQIAGHRIDMIFQKCLRMLDVARGLSAIHEIAIWIGGDMINNQLHPEAAEENWASPIEAIEKFQDHMATGLALLEREAKLPIRVITSVGNHGRLTKKMQSNAERHSLEQYAYRNLAKQFGGRIAFHVGRGYHNVQAIQGRKIRFHHGDAIKFQGGVGGVTIPARKKASQWNKQERCELDVFGHFHQFIDLWDMVVCGCLCGHNAYAIRIGADYQPPTQTFLVIDRDRGKVLCTPLFCD